MNSNCLIKSDDLKKLEHFNNEFGKNAVLVGGYTLDDVIDGYKILFYELVKDIDPSTGYYIVRQVGCFNGGDFYKLYNKDDFGYFSYDGSNEEAYPLSDNSIQIGHLRIVYRSIRFDRFGISYSTISFKRYWINDIDEIAKSNPEMAEKITSFLNEEISQLAAIQENKGYKSGWVYYQYLNREERLCKFVNGEILKDTKWLYSPLIHYNRFSDKFVQLSEYEQEQINKQIQDDPFF
jgi:hypothetical protein